MAEITNQLAPIKKTVDQFSGDLTRLYNSNGGPPGFLQTARAEDNGRFKMIFNMLEKLRPLEDFVLGYKATEEQRERDRAEAAEVLALKVDESEKRSNKRIAILGVVIAALMFCLGIWEHYDKHSKTEVVPMIQAQPKQDATIPTQP